MKKNYLQIKLSEPKEKNTTLYFNKENHKQVMLVFKVYNKLSRMVYGKGTMAVCNWHVLNEQRTVKEKAVFKKRALIVALIILKDKTKARTVVNTWIGLFYPRKVKV